MIKKLLMPGLRLKRWFLLVILGLIFMSVSMILIFGKEMQYIMKIIERECANLFSVPLGQYSPRILLEILFFIAGVIFVIWGLKRLFGFLVDMMPEKKGRIAHLVFKHSELRKGAKIAVLGGGTGLNSLLSGLKNYTNNITAIVTVFDEGGSSRRIRHELGELPPGDLRNCMVALADSGPLMQKLLKYRFEEGSGLKGHNFGNLLITAMSKITGGFEYALTETSKLFAIRGNVFPVSLTKTHLCAELNNGKIIEEEPQVEKHKITYPNSEVKRLFLKPSKVYAFVEAVKAIKKADIIILGPGSLYTSILPNLLVKGIPDAIKQSKAKKVYIANVMTQPGETNNYTAGDHVEKIIQYLGKGVLDYIVVNNERAPEELYRKYRKRGSDRVKFDEDRLIGYGIKVAKANLMTKEDLLRHDPDKLAKTILKLNGK